MRRSFVFLQRMPTRNLSLLVLGLSAIWLSLPCPSSLSRAQVPPITPSGLNTQVSDPTAIGGQTQYDITGGTRPNGGLNLFHSFGDFGVPNNNIANFLNETGLPTSNILGRITGGEVSNIFGTIQTSTSFGTANLFLMNPAGFLFGPNATVNVGGMLAFTSADYLRLAEMGTSNAGIFHADPTQASVLTNAPVAAFGFLGSNPGAITVQGSQFSVTDGQSISIVGGNITIQSGTPDGGTAQSARLSAPNGNIQLASARSPGEFTAAKLQPLPNVDDALFSSFGSVMLTPDSSINVSGTNNVSIRGGEFVLSVNDAVLSTAVAPATAETVVLGSGSAIHAPTQGSSLAGDINITATTVQLDGALIDASTTGPTPGGSITLRGYQKISAVDSLVATNAQSSELDGGDAGRIRFVSPVIDLQGSVLTSSTVGGGSGGAIILEGSSISLGASPISAPGSQGTDVQAITEGTGPGGNIIIRGFQGEGSRAGSVALSGFTRVLTETIGNLGNEGSAGKITIEAAHLSISDSTRVGSESLGSAGDAGSIHITAYKATISSQGLLSTSTDGVGNAGMIEIKAGALTLNSNGQIVSSSVQTGKAGTVTIQGLASPAQSVLIDGPGSGIFTETQGTGTGGDIALNANSIMIQNGGTLSAKTSGTEATATGGSITVNATDQVIMTDDASITASSTGLGNAGNIIINAGQTYTSTDSGVTTKAAHASGGNITVLAADRVELTNSHINASVEGSKTTVGGNIMIDPQYVILHNSQILAQATQGEGGNITLTITNGGLYLPDATSIVNADSDFGVNGTVTIQSPNAPASGKIQPLRNTLLDATSLLNQRCAALAGGEFSSFTVAGQDILPAEPGDWLASPLAMLSASAGRGAKDEGKRSMARGEGRESVTMRASLADESTLLSLRQITPPGFLTQSFAVDWSAGCQS